MTQDSTPHRGGTLRRFHLMIRSNWISTMGAAIATFAAIFGVTAWTLQSMAIWEGPYIGILTVLILPATVVFGLVLVPVGLLVYHRNLKARLDALADRPLYLARAVVMLTVVNFAGVATLGYAGVHEMSSVTFCGTACHAAMDPEFVAYQESPHAHVGCVDCHVGPGANWFIKSKLNGTRQLVNYVTDSYSRPIPTPVDDLRPANETCENCHWPGKYLGTKLMVRPHYREDHDVTAYVNVLLMRTGGLRDDGAATGIHWHAQPETEVEFISTDEKRQDVVWMRVRDADGEERIYTADGVDPATPPEGHVRRMDCTDCHNRAAHNFDQPDDAIDRAIAAGQISKRLPFVKKFAAEALRGDWSRDESAAGIRRAMHASYDSTQLLDVETRPLLEPAIDRLIAIRSRNVYPARKLFWNSYPDLTTHYGCMRCHEGKHHDAAGNRVPDACDVCHVVLSNEEESPAILDALGVRSQR